MQLLDVMERKFRDVLWILYASETDGDLCEIGRVEEGNVFDGDIVRVPVQATEVGEKDVIRSEVAQGRPGRERQVCRPGPLNLEIAHHSSISVNTVPIVWLRCALKVLDASEINHPS